MPSVNIRQLRDTRQLLAWLEAGEVVDLRKRNRVVARIVPEPAMAEINAAGRKRLGGSSKRPQAGRRAAR